MADYKNHPPAYRVDDDLKRKDAAFSLSYLARLNERIGAVVVARIIARPRAEATAVNIGYRAQ